MDLQRMKTLRELALKGSMIAASESLHLSASAVSQQISALEQEVGLALVERRGRGVQLTEAGLRLVRHADTLISVEERARADLAELRGTPFGEVRIATFPSIASRLLPEVMSTAARDYPGISLMATEIEPLPALAALRSWQCDIAFFDDLSLPKGFRAESIEVFQVALDELVAVLPRGHPLAARKGVPLKALKDEPWAIDARPNTFTDVIFEMCDRRGFRPRVIGCFDAYDVISALVAQGTAVSVIPRIRVTNAVHDGVVYRPLQPRVQRAIRMAVRRAEIRRPALRVVVDLFRNAAASLEQA